jgi:hypothetical protein
MKERNPGIHQVLNVRGEQGREDKFTSRNYAGAFCAGVRRASLKQEEEWQEEGDNQCRLYFF